MQEILLDNRLTEVLDTPSVKKLPQGNHGFTLLSAWKTTSKTYGSWSYLPAKLRIIYHRLGTRRVGKLLDFVDKFIHL